MRKIDIKQGSPEWHELRAKSIGASDAPIIMGVSPWMTPYQLWRLKVGLDEPKAPTAAMQRGTNNEEQARFEFSKDYHSEYVPMVGISKEYDWMIASFDGVSTDGQILEIKWPGNEDHTIACSGNVPDKYYPQLQHQMIVADVLNMDYYSCNDKHPQQRAVVRVGANFEYQIKLMQKLIEFRKCIVTLTPPPLSERDVVERDDSKWREACMGYRNASEVIAQWESTKEQYKNKMIELSGNMNCKGAGAFLTRVTKKGSVDYAKIPELANVDLDKYRKDPTECWRITLD